MRARPSNTLSFGLRPQPIADSRAIPWLAPADLPRIHSSKSFPGIQKKSLLRNERTPMSAHQTPRKLGLFSAVALLAVAALLSAPSVYAQIESGRHGRSRIVQGSNETDRVALTGNTHPEARTANDR